MDSPTGPRISEASVNATGAWQTYTDITVPISNPGGVHDLFFVFKRPGTDGLLNLNWIDFVGRGFQP